MQRLAIADALHRAMALARGGQLANAEALLAEILASNPAEPDALQLLGMIARQRGDQQNAVALYRRSLAIRPAQPNVLNNLGNSLTQLRQHADAVAAYDVALALQPCYPDAQINLGTALIAIGRLDDARRVLGHLVESDPGNARGWSSLALAQREAGLFQNAIAAFRTSLALRPGHIATLHNLAVAMRLSGDAQAAVPVLLDCAVAEPCAPEIRYNLGHCYQDLGRFEEATEAYRDVIALRPTDRDAHDSLNRLLWRQGAYDAYLASYRAALTASPDDQGLLADLAHRLNLDGRHAEAIALLATAPRETAEIRHRLGQAFWAGGQIAAAFAEYDAVLAIDPDYTPVAREAARAHIILDRPDEALTMIAPVLARDPYDQQALALRGLGWRFTGDRRAGDLNDYERLVSTSILTPPGGDVAVFNARLETVLAALHDEGQHPLEQTLRQGTQTSDDLFARTLPEIATIRSMIEAAVRSYIDALPDDPDHPFLRRKTSAFAFPGSWSVRLRRAGFHMNHVHPDGWISSCYYVGLPAAVAEGQQGWLKFGETGLHLGERERIARTVRPAVGMLVLFPSYFYHGTIPFDEDAYRTTIAFDVVPRATAPGTALA